MNTYYHYCTWRGRIIAEDGIIKPSTRYAKNICGPTAPALVFLTTNPYWEPSVQAKDINGRYTRQPSDPKDYRKKLIPLWRFEVEVKLAVNIIYNVPGFISMLQDAKELDSDMSLWHWSTESFKVVAVREFNGLDWVKNEVLQ